MVGARVAMKASDWTTTFGDGRAPINVDQFHTVVHRVIKMPQTRGAPVKNIVLCNLIGEDTSMHRFVPAVGSKNRQNSAVGFIDRLSVLTKKAKLQ